VDSPFRGLFSPVGRKSVSCPIFFIIKTPFHSRFSHLTGIFNISQAALLLLSPFLNFFRAHLHDHGRTPEKQELCKLNSSQKSAPSACRRGIAVFLNRSSGGRGSR